MQEKTKYNHAFDIAFEVITDKKDPNDVTPEELLVGLLRRIANLIEEDLENKGKDYMGASVFIEACDCFDTHIDDTVFSFIVREGRD